LRDQEEDRVAVGCLRWTRQYPLQGCFDEPLLDVSANLSVSLGHVHIVDEDEMVGVEVGQNAAAVELERSSDEAGYDSDSNDEFEF